MLSIEEIKSLPKDTVVYGIVHNSYGSSIYSILGCDIIEYEVQVVSLWGDNAGVPVTETRYTGKWRKCYGRERRYDDQPSEMRMSSAIIVPRNMFLSIDEAIEQCVIDKIANRRK